MPGSVHGLKDTLLRAIDSSGNVLDMKLLTQVVTDLEQAQITAEDLTITRLGLYVNNIRRSTSDKALAKRMKELLKYWKLVVQNSQSNGISTPDPEPAVAPPILPSQPHPPNPGTNAKPVKNPLAHRQALLSKFSAVKPSQTVLSSAKAPPIPSQTTPPTVPRLTPGGIGRKSTPPASNQVTNGTPPVDSLLVCLPLSLLPWQHSVTSLVVKIPLSLIVLSTHSSSVSPSSVSQFSSSLHYSTNNTVSTSVTSSIVTREIFPPLKPLPLKSFHDPSMVEEQPLDIIPSPTNDLEQPLPSLPSLPPPVIPEVPPVLSPVLQSVPSPVIPSLPSLPLAVVPVLPSLPLPVVPVLPSLPLPVLPSPVVPSLPSPVVPSLPSPVVLPPIIEEPLLVSIPLSLLNSINHTPLTSTALPGLPSGRLKPLHCVEGVDGCYGNDSSWYSWTEVIPNVEPMVTVFPYVYIDGIEVAMEM